MSNRVNYFNIYNQNTEFVLKENWMNLAFGNFLFNYFDKEKLNGDDLFVAEQKILFQVSKADLQNRKNLNTLDFLSFLYEYQNGVNFSLPFSPVEFVLDIIAKKRAHQELPKAMTIFDDIIKQYASIIRIKPNNLESYMSFVHQAINLQTSEETRTFFAFEPATPLEDGQFPPFLQVALFDLILPLCHERDRFFEALRISDKAKIFSQVLLDQLSDKFPDLAHDVFSGLRCILPAAQRVDYSYGPRNEIVGLDYLLSRNAVNPFSLDELLAMNPELSELMYSFLSLNTMTLTEVDMLIQMIEANLFADIEDEELNQKIASAVSGKVRSETLMAFAKISQMI